MNDYYLNQAFCLKNKIAIQEICPDRIIFGCLRDATEKAKEIVSRSVRRKSEGSMESVFRVMEKEKWVQLITSNFKATSSENSESQKSLSSEKDNKALIILEGLLQKARLTGATDIHIEKDCVRFRIGGSLERIIRMPDEDFRIVVQKIKMMSELNLVEKRKCQDGKFIFKMENDENVYVRVSCVPALSEGIMDYSESVVLRILDPARNFLELENLGFDTRQVSLINDLCCLKNGLVLMCGPTGSGKSTTAGAMLEKIHNVFNGTKKIMSLEDPPEYVLPGVTQIKIEKDYCMDFKQAFRSVLRQDPDVIFIGEIRDQETAEIAVQASMTGHLVLATLHTQNFEQTKMRLEELGQKKSHVESVLKGVVLQELERGKLKAKIWAA